MPGTPDRDAPPAAPPLLARLTRRLPPWWGVGALPHLLAVRHTRHDRPEVRAVVHGVALDLRARNDIESFMLFGPQFYERREVRLMERHLRPGDVFVDAGSYVGFYALVASRLVGSGGRALAVEMDPRNVARIRRHVALNRAGNVRIVHAAVSGEDGEALVQLHEARHSAYNTLRGTMGSGTRVPLRTLPTLLREAGLPRVHGLKLDVEGMEEPALRRLFEQTPPEEDPRLLVVERSDDHLGAGAPDPLGLVEARGYRLAGRDSWNWLFLKDGA